MRELRHAQNIHRCSDCFLRCETLSRLLVVDHDMAVYVRYASSPFVVQANWRVMLIDF